MAAASHRILAAKASSGNGSDAPDFEPLLFDSWRRAPKLKSVVADAGYDSENNHAYARQRLGIRSTVIQLNKRGGRRWAKTKYRRQMYRRFAKLKYRQRAQVESTISRFKRRLTSSLRGRSRRTQRVEVHLRVLTHDLLLLAE